MKYLCDHFKVCRNSIKCGLNCMLTDDKEHEMELKPNTRIECVCVMDREIIENWLSETDIDYRVDGFNIILKPLP